MSAIGVICGIVIIIASVIVIACVTLMEPSQNGLGAISGDTSTNFFGANTGRTKEAMLKRTTWIMSAVIVVMILILWVVK